jgi:hypothetical protein
MLFEVELLTTHHSNKQRIYENKYNLFPLVNWGASSIMKMGTTAFSETLWYPRTKIHGVTA